VAAAAREVLAFDGMGVNMSDRPGAPAEGLAPEEITYVAYGIAGEGAAEKTGRRRRLADALPGLRLTAPGTPDVFPLDREIRASISVSPFLHYERFEPPDPGRP